MKRSIVKPILFGILFGTAAFFAPFLTLKIVLLCMLLGFIFKMFRMNRYGGHGGMSYGLLYADKVRSMNDEEYAAFKTRLQADPCGNHYGHHCCGRKENRESMQ